jgi:hypothetical protein
VSTIRDRLIYSVFALVFATVVGVIMPVIWFFVWFEDVIETSYTNRHFKY